LPSCAAQQRRSMLPQRGANEIGLATVSLACTWQFAKFENRKYIHNAGHRSDKKAQETATKNQSHLPASTSIEEVLARLILIVQTFLSRILVHYPIASTVQPWLARGWCVHITHRICLLARPMESPQCKDNIISLLGRFELY